MFDRKDIELNSESILITNGGKFQVNFISVSYFHDTGGQSDEIKGFFQFDIIINVLVSSFRCI